MRAYVRSRWGRRRCRWRGREGRRNRPATSRSPVAPIHIAPAATHPPTPCNNERTKQIAAVGCGGGGRTLQCWSALERKCAHVRRLRLSALSSLVAFFFSVGKAQSQPKGAPANEHKPTGARARARRDGRPRADGRGEWLSSPVARARTSVVRCPPALTAGVLFPFQ
jgi:hypothetical protein